VFSEKIVLCNKSPQAEKVMKKHLRIFVFFDYQKKETRHNDKGPYDLNVNVYRMVVDITGLDDVDSHFLSGIVNRSIHKKEEVHSGCSHFDEIWILGMKEFMWRIGYEIEFVDISSEEGWKKHNDLSQNDKFGWLDFRRGYPRYEHQE
jgi:hypothetical protein